MERATRELTTAKGHKVKLITFLTRGERIQIDSAGMINAVGNIDQTSKNIQMSKFFDRRAAEETLLKVIVKEYDGLNGEGMIKKILDELDENESNEIFDLINEVTNPETDKKKS